MKKMTKFWNAVKIPLLAILCSLVVGGVQCLLYLL